MSTRTAVAAVATDRRTDEHTSTKSRGVNPIDALLTFYGIIALLTGAFLAFTALAIRFSEHNNEPVAHVCGWVAFAFFVADMFYIGADWEC